MSEYGEFCHDLREARRDKNRQAIAANTEKIKAIAEKYGLKLNWFTAFHVRVWRADMKERFDYYPTSGKIQFGGKMQYKPQIEEWIVKVFQL